MSARPSFPAFACWAVVGAGFCLAVLTALTIGPLVLAVSLLAAAVLGWHRRSAVNACGLGPGAGLVLVYVAFLNRDGPGDVCTTTATSQSCITEYSPWPWLAAGIILVVAGLAIFLGMRRARPPGSTGTTGRSAR